MILLLTTNWFPLLVALAIGLATAWWLWGHSAAYDWTNNFDGDADDYRAPAASFSSSGNFADNIDASKPAISLSGPQISPARGAPDNLMILRGIGPKLNEMLTSLGITRFDQIAAWTEADIAEIDPYLEPFSGRIEREKWVEQARLLAAGDMGSFQEKFGKI